LFGSAARRQGIAGSKPQAAVLRRRIELTRGGSEEDRKARQRENVRGAGT
jgi:hypothetical protein